MKGIEDTLRLSEFRVCILSEELFLSSSRPYLRMLVGFRERILKGIKDIRNQVEKFKDEHKMASTAISVLIDGLPDPFGKVATILWDGIEKDDEDQVEVKLAEEFVQIIEKLRDEKKKSLEEINEKLNSMINTGASKHDIRELGGLIRESNKPVVELIDSQFEKLQKRLNELEHSFHESVNRLSLQALNLNIITANTPYSIGERICWKKAKFNDEDIRSRYDWRRPVTDDIIQSIQQHEATVIYGEPYMGKSIVAKRVMFELIEQGYCAIFSPSAAVSGPDGMKSLLLELSKIYPRILFIADDAHKKTSEAHFAVFNKLQGITSGKLRFLFVAREKQLSKEANEVERALSKIHSQPGKSEFQIGFTENDAIQIISKAIHDYHQRDPLQEELDSGSSLYQYSQHDPLMFSLGLRHILEGEKELADFVQEEIKENMFSKISELKDKKNIAIEDLWRSAILACLIGIVNVPLNLRTSGELLFCSNVRPEYIRELSQNDILLDGPDDELRIMHEMFAYEFLSFLYSDKCCSNPKMFFHDYGSIIDCVWKSLKPDSIVDMLNSCSYLYSQPRYRQLSNLITSRYLVPFEEYTVPEHFGKPDGAKVYLYGLGKFYYDRGDYKNSREYYRQALNIHAEIGDKVGMGRSYTSIGIVLKEEGNLPEALDCHTKALDIFSEIGDKVGMGKSYGNMGNVLTDMRRLPEALDCHTKALEINTEIGDKVGMGKSYGNIGIVLKEEGNLPEALDNLKKALSTNVELGDRSILTPIYANMGNVLRNMDRLPEALDNLKKALDIDTEIGDKVGMGADYANMGNVLRNMDRLPEALDNLKKALDIFAELGDKVRMAAVYHNMAIAFSKTDSKNEAQVAISEGLKILLQLKKDTGYHHPLIDNLESQREQL